MKEHNHHEGVQALQEKDEPSLSTVIFVLSLVLAFGLGVGVYVLMGITIPNPLAGVLRTQLQAAAVTKVVSKPPEILLTDSPRAQILVDIGIASVNVSTSLDEYAVPILIKEEDGSTRPAHAREFLNAISARPISERLLHSLDTSLTYSIYTTGEISGRLRLVSRSYPNTFAAMLDYEGIMARDILPLTHPRIRASDIVMSGKRTFVDERINNIDTRVLLDPFGDVLIIYGFLDKKTLLIAGDRDAFTQNTPKQ